MYTSMLPRYYHHGHMRPTNDDWYPNFPGNLVRVSMSPLSNGKWRVCVWGADDHGMERDVDTREQAMTLWRRMPVVIEQQVLWGLGFVLA